MFQLLLPDTTSTLVRSALDKMHSFGLVPRSRYTTSWEGLTFKQAIHMPLPPYLSPIPVIFRMMAYAVITPFVFLLFLDIGGYIVWRIYEGVSLTGTRTAFYKFRTSPVFVRSRTGSPVIGKGSSSNSKANDKSNINNVDSTVLGPSPPHSPPGTRETSISPISSSASLQDETYGMNSDGELVSHSSSASSSPPSRHEILLYDTTGDSLGGNTDNSTALSHLESANLDASIRRRAISRHSANSGTGSIGNSNKRFTVGSDDGDDDKSYGGAAEERESTPTLTSSSSTSVNPLHLTRSNSLGLGFSTSAAEPSPSSTKDSDHVSQQQQQQQQPTMYIASSSSTTNRDQPSLSSHTKQTSSVEDLVKIERSPAASTGSSANLEEEDDKIFKEAKEVTGSQS